MSQTQATWTICTPTARLNDRRYRAGYRQGILWVWFERNQAIPICFQGGKTVDQLALGVHEDETGILRKAERQMTQEICFAPTLRRDNPGAFKPTLIRNVKGLLHGLRWNEFVSVVPKRRCRECPFELRQLIK